MTKHFYWFLFAKASLQYRHKYCMRKSLRSLTITTPNNGPTTDIKFFPKLMSGPVSHIPRKHLVGFSLCKLFQWEILGGDLEDPSRTNIEFTSNIDFLTLMPKSSMSMSETTMLALSRRKMQTREGSKEEFRSSLLLRFKHVYGSLYDITATKHSDA